MTPINCLHTRRVEIESRSDRIHCTDRPAVRSITFYCLRNIFVAYICRLRKWALADRPAFSMGFNLKFKNPKIRKRKNGQIKWIRILATKRCHLQYWIQTERHHAPRTVVIVMFDIYENLYV